MKLRVLVADDNLLFRRVITDVIAALPEFEVVGAVANGVQALRKVRELAPDLLTLDLEMPEMDGLETMDALRREGLAPNIIVVSALSRRGGEMTLRAMDKGAFDFITKPEGSSAEHSRQLLVSELVPRIRALQHRLEVRSILRGGAPPAAGTSAIPGLGTNAGPGAPGGAVAPAPPPAAPRTAPRALTGLGPGKTNTGDSVGNGTAAGAGGASPGRNFIAPMARRAAPAPAPVVDADSASGTGDGASRAVLSFGRPDLLLIGVSTGGPVALGQLLPLLPSKLGVPLLIVQHMPPVFTKALADSLAQRVAFPVVEAADGDVVVADRAYIAPGGSHMRVAVPLEGGLRIEITNDPPENNCRPAVDYLFRSVAERFTGRVLAVVLTGMGSDGMLGVRQLKKRSCFAMAQDEASCVVYGMPKAVVDAGLADAVLPLDGIAGRIAGMLRGC